MSEAEQLFELLDALDASAASVVTSVRQPVTLRDAVKVAVKLGMATSTNDATVQAVRDHLETFAQHLALEEHYQRHPHARPSLADLAIAAAELDAHPLADEHNLLRLAAGEVVQLKPDATSDDVLVYAAALRSPSRAPV